MNAYCRMNTEELERFSLGQASAEETERFEEHLLCCENCQKRYEEVESYSIGVRHAAGKLAEERVSQQSWWSWPRLAPVLAGLVLLICVAVVIRMSERIDQPLAISLTAMRGSIPGGSAPAGRALSLTPDLTGIAAPGPYRLELVDERGRVTWQGVYDSGRDAVAVTGQREGAHFVRLYSQSGELLREYGLTVGK